MMSSIAGNTEFTKLYVPIVTLSTEDNIKLAKQLSEGFKRSVYWNHLKTETIAKYGNKFNLLRILLGESFQRAKRLPVLAF